MEEFLSTFMQFGQLEYFLFFMNVVIYCLTPEGKILFFVKEFAEYFLLFSGCILALAAKPHAERYVPDAIKKKFVVLYHAAAQAISKLEVVRKVSCKLFGVNSPLQSDKDWSQKAAQTLRSQRELMVDVPKPVKASLKFMLVTGNLALFSAFAAYGN